MTLRRKLLLWYSGVFFASAVFLVVTMYLLIAHKTRSQFFRYFEDEYEEAQRIVKENLTRPAEMRMEVEREVGGKRFFDLSYELYDAAEKKHMLLLAPEWEDDLPALSIPRQDGEESQLEVRQVGDDPEDIIYFRTGWVDRQQHPNLVLRVGMSYEHTYERLEDLGEFLAGALIVSVILSVFGGVFLAARSLDPIDEVAGSLERVEAHHLADRLEEPKVQDEVGRIVSAANRMLSRLEDSFDRMSRFAGDAAHELRTPLSTLKCGLEVELQRKDLPIQSREALTHMLEQVDETASVVDSLLFLAKLDAAGRLEHSETVDLGLVVEDLTEVFQAWATQEEVDFDIACEGKCPVEGDRTLLHRLLANLIENAVCYTPSGGQVEVCLSQQHDGVRLKVSDSGIGIDEADLDRVFDRFYRAEQSRSKETGGTGLGLSICRRVVELHGGTIQIDSEKGVGTTVTVDLPSENA